MEEERLLRLELPQMVGANNDSYRTAFTVSVDYRHGTTTGVSAADRAATITALANPQTAADDFARPGSYLSAAAAPRRRAGARRAHRGGRGPVRAGGPQARRRAV